MNAPSVSASIAADSPLAWRTSLRLGIGAIYGAAAVPLFFIYNILPASLRQAGQPPEIANLVFLAYLPFALRVVWAPLVDRLGRGRTQAFRRVALACLGLAIISTGGLIAFEPATDAVAITAVATLVIALIATAAVALDGYLLIGLAPAVRARSAGLQGMGFAFGGLVMGLGITACDGAGWTVIVLLLMAMTALLAAPALLLPAQIGAVGHARAMQGRGGLGRFLFQPGTRRRIALSLLTHGGLGLAGGMLPVLQVDAGLTLGQIGLLAAIGSNGIGLAAAWLTGAALRRWSAWRVAMVISLLSGLCFAALASGPVAVGPAQAIGLSLVVMALGYAFFVSYRALVLPICSGERGATQAAALSSADAFIATVAAIAAGPVIGRGGLPLLLGLAGLLCSAGALVAWRADRRSGEAPDIKS